MIWHYRIGVVTKDSVKTYSIIEFYITTSITFKAGE